MPLIAGSYGRCDSQWRDLLAALPGGVGSRRWEGDFVRLACVGASAAESSDGVSVVSGRLDDVPSLRAASALAEAYWEGGIAGVARLRGDYAFLVWDKRRGALLAGCDAVGLRAPAYAWNGRSLLVSSQALPLVAASGDASWDDNYFAHALAGFWNEDAERTPFRSVRRLRAGEVLQVTPGGMERMRSARLAVAVSRQVRADEAAVELCAAVDRAVALRHSDDQRTCVAMSGGLDSWVVAASVARTTPLQAFTIVENGESGGVARAALGHVLDRMSVHAVRAPDSGVAPAEPTEEVVVAAPSLQPARLALLHAARSAGFGRVLDGDGGDEVFDLAWRAGDELSALPVRVLLKTFARRSTLSRLARDVLSRGSLGPFSSVWLRRAWERLPGRRPWLHAAFWLSAGLTQAWEETIAYWRLPTARDRMAHVLDAAGRHWRAQETARMAIGIEGASPLLDQSVIELVASLPAAAVVDPPHTKALLRRLAEMRLPHDVAWRPKRDPVYAHVLRRFVVEPARVERVRQAVVRMPYLAESIDPRAMITAVESVRQSPALPTGITMGLEQLFALVEWAEAVEDRLRTFVHVKS